MPTVQRYNLVRDDIARGQISGTQGDDHIIHHREGDAIDHSGTGLVGFAGNDTLEASVPVSGQIHMFAGPGDDHLILDVTKASNAAGMQGHHAYGGTGADIYEFTNLANNHSPIVGRLDDFNPTEDIIKIEGQIIDLEDLPKTITLETGESFALKIISIEHPEFVGEDLGAQYFLAIGDDIFYALDGARDLQNGLSDLIGEERHFLLPSALDALRSAEAVDYFNPKNFVPTEFYESYGDNIELLWTPPGEEVVITPNSDYPTHLYAGKVNANALSSRGEQTITGSDQADIINANTGNDTVFGEGGDDLIAGGIDNDYLDGGSGNDSMWGGDGNDTLLGRDGNDYLHGGRGNDIINGGDGSDIIVAGSGDDTLTGGGSESDINQFHFSNDDGHALITDFKVGIDKISLQHEIDPLTVEVIEGDNGNVIVNYGQEASIELENVSLEEFQDAATVRSSEDNPIISISVDPEDQLAQQILAESGFYGENEPPTLEIEGVQYGSEAFDEDSPGGYFYAQDDEPEPEPEPELEPDDPWPIPTWPSTPADDDPDDPDDDDGDVVDDDDDSNSESCFVATAAYQDPWHPEVVYLRRFRDQWLVNRALGRAFVRFYWTVGPILAVPVRKSPMLQDFSKKIIRILIVAFKRKLE